MAGSKRAMTCAAMNQTETGKLLIKRITTINASRQYRLGIIGGGNMAEAIVRGALDQKILTPEQLVISDPQPQRREVFAAWQVEVTRDNQQVVAQSDQLMLAVKPQMLSVLTDILKQIDVERQVVISIMAGITTARISELIGGRARVIRVMPNTPLMVGLGMSAIALGEHATERDAELTMRLFAAAGEADLVDESLMDAVTAVSGSGPAYLFYLAEAMVEAAGAMGFDDALSQRLVRQTLRGAAELLARSPEDAAQLRRRVTSPGGTTEAAISHMEDGDVRSIVRQAVERAAQRSRELGA
jgi:pyrroline-5-carboxylate reductase